MNTLKNREYFEKQVLLPVAVKLIRHLISGHFPLSSIFFFPLKKTEMIQEELDNDPQIYNRIKSKETTEGEDRMISEIPNEWFTT